MRRCCRCPERPHIRLYHGPDAKREQQVCPSCGSLYEKNFQGKWVSTGEKSRYL